MTISIIYDIITLCLKGGEKMKALTLHPGWAFLMFSGDKTIECRTWKTTYRGDIIICSSAEKMKNCISGHALVVAELVDCVPFKKEHLGQAAMEKMPNGKCYAWLFKNVRMIYPVPVKGKRGLFDLDIPIKYVPEEFSESEAEDFIKNVLTPITFLPDSL